VTNAVAIGAGVDAAATAGLREIDGRPVAWFRVAGGKHHGALGSAGAGAVARAVRTGLDARVPIVGVLDTSGAELRDNVAALDGWGRIARVLAHASGVVPTMLSVIGPCVSGPALLLGLVDVVVMTADAFAYVSGPDSVAEFTGIAVDRRTLGGAAMHSRTSGVASLIVENESAAADAIASVLSYLPSHHLDDPPRVAVSSADRDDRSCTEAANTVPAAASRAYDVREVVEDVLDADSFLELRADYAANLVTALGRLSGRAVGIVANQPAHRAGTLDIEASRKAARFVEWCDAFNVPIITFVDTPGFEPGRDLEWRGMIRHGAELVHAYSAATVPRVCVVLRKAYGGAYIVMDSRGVGNDVCFAWPGAEIAVMGAAGAVRILHGRRLAALDPDEQPAREQTLIDEYEGAFSNPYRAAERGYVDAVIEPADTRRVLTSTLDALCTKRDRSVGRKHSNGPL
jgi:acetyl-CoA carboxylase carboxyltransferase component